MGPMLTWAQDFFARNPFFTAADFATEYAAQRERSASPTSMLIYYVHTGHLVRVTRGVYASVGTQWHEHLLAGKLGREPIILAYNSAQAAHGWIEIAYHCVTITPRKTQPVLFNEVQYRTVRSPIADPFAHTMKIDGLTVTTPARTLVDCFDRLDLGDDFLTTYETFARSPDLIDVDLDEVVTYAALLNRPVTAARVGACLWGHPRWRRYDGHQFALARMGCRQTMYADPSLGREPSAYISRFRLRVPGEFHQLARELRLDDKRSIEEERSRRASSPPPE